MLKSFLCAPLLMLALSAAAPQQEPAAIVDRLTGDCPRVWVYGDFSSVSAGERAGECKGSDAWAFYSDNRLVVKKCRNKRLITEEKRWSVESGSSGGAVLKVDGDEYELRFASEETPARRVRLTLNRRRPAAKSDAGQELVFYRYREIE